MQNPSGTEEGEKNSDGTVEEEEKDSNDTSSSDTVETQSFSITQQSHPIRNFFSSLFK